MVRSLQLPLIDVTTDNVEQTGFFCYMSKKRSEGYQRKLARVRARLAESRPSFNLMVKKFDLGAEDPIMLLRALRG